MATIRSIGEEPLNYLASQFYVGKFIVRQELRSLRDRIKSLRKSDSILAQASFAVIRFAWLCVIVPYRVSRDFENRSLILTSYLHPNEIHQFANYTEMDRYPSLFSDSQALIQDQSDLRILSYGCSTGEEVLTLRTYFSAARILGVDIDKANIKKARLKTNDSRITFSHRIKESLDAEGPFDLVFVLAVLQRTGNRNPGVVDSSEIYPFESFNAKAIELDQHLRVGGILVIAHSDYHFEDSDPGSRYLVAPGNHSQVPQRCLFGRDNRLVSQNRQVHHLFVKQS